MIRREVLLVVLLVIIAVCVFHLRNTDPKKVYVAVLQPTLSEDDELQCLAGEAVVVSATRALWHLKNAFPLDDSEIQAVGSSDPATVCKAIGADEAIISQINQNLQGYNVHIERIGKQSGQWTTLRGDTIEAATHLEIDEAVQRVVLDLYNDRGTTVGLQSLVVPQDHLEYLRLRKQYRESPESATLPVVVDRLEEICGRSPGLVRACALGVMVAAYYYQITGQEEYVKRAEAIVNRLKDEAGTDPIFIQSRLSLALRTRNISEAELALAEFAQRVPHHPYLLRYRALLAMQKGDDQTALEYLEAAVEERSSWRNLWALGDAELRYGQPEMAVDHLQDALELVPDRVELQAKLAEAVLYSCDLERAENLWLEICSREPRALYLANLGTAQLLQGKYEMALRRFETVAVELRLPVLSILLADVHMALGNETQATEFYHQATERVSEDAAPYDLALKAYALAHLGDTSDAVALIEQALADDPARSNVTYQGALVYSIAGDKEAALLLAGRASEQGYGSCWFQKPWWGIQEEVIR